MGLSFTEIERKTGVQAHTARYIYATAERSAGNEDIYDVLACCEAGDRSGRPVRIEDGSQLSTDIREAVLRLPEEKQCSAVDQENIEIPAQSGQKRPSRSMIQRITHKHTHESALKERQVGEIVRAAQPTKPRLNKGDNERKRKTTSQWIVDELHQGSIFICSDESFHEIGGGPRKKQRISREKGEPGEHYARPQGSVQFAIMQWGCHSTEAVLGPQHLWDQPTKEELQAMTASIQYTNDKAIRDTQLQRLSAQIPGTDENILLEVLSSQPV